MRLFITSILIIFYLFGYTQERINKKLPVISSEKYGELKTAKGWLYNPEGQWISRINRIPKFLENEFNSLIDYESYSLGIDNFINYELRKIKINDSAYYILIKIANGGYYKYPNIQKEWIKTKDVYFYILDTSVITRTMTIQSDTSLFVKMPLLYSGIIDRMFSVGSYLNDIKLKIAKDWKGYENQKENIDYNGKPYDNYLCLNLKINSNKKNCRFLLFNYYNLSGDNIWGLPGFGAEEHIKFRADNLDHIYFETSLVEFQKLFKNIKTN